VNVTKKPCVLEECPAGEIQHLYTCGCVPYHDALGDIYDINATEVSHIRLDVGEFFTVREFAPSSNDYEWISPDFSTLGCVNVEGSFEDPWFRYKQVVLQTTSDVDGGCR
jgi:hypothetical protein